MATKVLAIRGATVVEHDSVADITERVAELVGEMMSRNKLASQDIISAIFTATDDIVSMFPATAARKSFMADVPLLCARELSVEGAIERCIRVMMHVETSLSRQELQHIYLHEAITLRDEPRN